MILKQSLLYYSLSILTTFGLFNRLKQYLDVFFPKNFSIIVTTAILFHPFSIDAFMGPNLLKGPVSFWVLLEALFFLRDKKWTYALVASVVAAAINISYFLFPLYFFISIKKEERKRFLVPAICYVALLIPYLWKLDLLGNHNPITFISYYLQYLLFPVTLTVLTPALFPFSIHAFFTSVIILILILWREEKNKVSRPFWALLFLPVLGVFFHHWSEQYRIWSEVLFSGSTYLCITFAFITMLAMHIPKKLFVAYAAIMVILSATSFPDWRPFSKMIGISLRNLPDDYKEVIIAKRTLAWQFLYEGKTKEAKVALEDLIRQYNDEESKADLAEMSSDPMAASK